MGKFDAVGTRSAPSTAPLDEDYSGNTLLYVRKSRTLYPISGANRILAQDILRLHDMHVLRARIDESYPKSREQSYLSLIKYLLDHGANPNALAW